MGDRVPGIVGDEPSAADGGDSDAMPPGAGFDLPGVSGADAGSGSPVQATVQIFGWPRNISWDEFKELRSRPEGEDEDAQTHSEADQPERVTVHSVGGWFRVTALTVRVRIVSGDTWVVGPLKTDNLLNHEQGHYDITGVLGRDMANEIVAARARNVQGLQEQVAQIIERYTDRADAWTKLYDHETEHSRNDAAQRRWDRQLRDSIRSGCAFSPP